jgi:hypothetical protein
MRSSGRSGGWFASLLTSAAACGWVVRVYRGETVAGGGAGSCAAWDGEGAGAASGKWSSAGRVTPGLEIVAAVAAVPEVCEAVAGDTEARIFAGGSFSESGSGEGASIHAMPAMAGSTRAVARMATDFCMAVWRGRRMVGLERKRERILEPPEKRLVPGEPDTSLSFRVWLRAGARSQTLAWGVLRTQPARRHRHARMPCRRPGDR